MHIDLSFVRILYFTGQAIVHNPDQGKDYLVEVEVTARIEKGHIIVENIVEPD